MAVNNYDRHLLIIPEDDAYRDIANGFVGHFAVADKKIRVEKPAGGWLKLRQSFTQDHEKGLRQYPKRHVLMLLDLDGSPNRAQEFTNAISKDIRERVFLLCCRNEAENVKKELGYGHFEPIGQQMAQSCYDNARDAPESPWTCGQLRQNEGELRRLAEAVCSFLFLS